MTYSVVLTPVADSPEVEPHLAAAVEIAHAFDATLIGSAAEFSMPRSGDVASMDFTGELVLAERTLVDEELKAAEARFCAAAAMLNRPPRWLAGAELPLKALLRRAAAADLIVLGAMPDDQGDIVRHIAVGDVVMQAGRPVLAAPAGGLRRPRTVMIAWKNCREARRAVADALPFLKRAETVLAYVAPEGHGRQDGAASLTPLIDYLEDHEIRCTGVALPYTRTPGDDLLAAAARAGADLLVSGAYGRSRMEEWVFGGVTRTLLNRAHLPVLFSH